MPALDVPSGIDGVAISAISKGKCKERVQGKLIQVSPSTQLFASAPASNRSAEQDEKVVEDEYAAGLAPGLRTTMFHGARNNCCYVGSIEEDAVFGHRAGRGFFLIEYRKLGTVAASIHDAVVPASVPCANENRIRVRQPAEIVEQPFLASRLGDHPEVVIRPGVSPGRLSHRAEGYQTQYGRVLFERAQ